MSPANPMFSTPEMAAIFSPEAHVGRMLEFEAALAQAEAAAGVIPAEAAQAIAAACRVERFDIPALYRAAVPAGTLAIPLVRALTEQVTPEGRDYVHWGATSQDVIDTAMVLQMRDGLTLLIDRLLAVGDACAALAEQHRRTLMPGRTLMQQALPITFGLKAARWLGMTTRQVARLDALRREALVVQFGGAAGTLASLGDAGTRVVELLAERLGLGVPDLPWHAERDRVAEIAAALGVVSGAMAKIATDLVLLAQTEVGEVSEGAAPGKGGSSAMPQKRNPVDATFALAAARLAMGAVPVVLSGMAQEQERAVGGWQAEWEALPDLFLATASAVERVRQALDGLEVDAVRMRENLGMGGGLLLSESLTMALARRVGRPAAYRLVQAAVARVREDGTTLRDAALADEQIRAVLSEDEIDQALDPAGYIGSADVFIDRALARYREVRAAVQ
ncbi:3-carboxy-cis,cis-muconate cycloisomerase [Sphaerobacter sp.]|uniref:3-carboxy-cis,cis-muconate cycloisomerase n=1 Tax=Sphaerobacter sp. TaxID=2099654 RepID=UPI001DA82F46|nr:3-carboxy-cis,cis-muconate cycloisomerase [Sphaerobacter sp.]MBX5444471.1 3-carboxy-cis,cis-muconate cycloisomerase [Sphaerobacter sp.]